MPQAAAARRAPEPPAGFVEAVLAVVDDIPPGCVATYGDIAAILGSRGARARPATTGHPSRTSP